ncbi:hypothetical protein [Burkholderia gladioli]|uniref:hypothetical protein n=1 Tax=Burkholderia gladioli TaxID=28095 RepID=UPI001C5DC8F5|nr:hypothetical protein [Burkholderia gladioli]MBW5284203.1 hypothetical protein [Burkholderia gladioli]
MSRRKRIWRDIRDIHFQLNYDTDPEVATFVHEFGSSSLARLIKNLLFQHLVGIAHPTSQRSYCTNIRIQALMQQLDPESRAVASRAAGIGDAAQPRALPTPSLNPVETPQTLENAAPLVSASAIARPVATQEIPLPAVQVAVQAADPERGRVDAPRAGVSDPAGQVQPEVTPAKPESQSSQLLSPTGAAVPTAAAETVTSPRHTGPNNKLVSHFLKD